MPRSCPRCFFRALGGMFSAAKPSTSLLRAASGSSASVSRTVLRAVAMHSSVMSAGTSRMINPRIALEVSAAAFVVRSLSEASTM